MSVNQVPPNHRVWYAYGTTMHTFTGRDTGTDHRTVRAVIQGPDDSNLSEGLAICNEEKDNFCRKIGRDIALGRALKRLRQK